MFFFWGGAGHLRFYLSVSDGCWYSTSSNPLENVGFGGPQPRPSIGESPLVIKLKCCVRHISYTYQDCRAPAILNACRSSQPFALLENRRRVSGVHYDSPVYATACEERSPADCVITSPLARSNQRLLPTSEHTASFRSTLRYCIEISSL